MITGVDKVFGDGIKFGIFSKLYLYRSNGFHYNNIFSECVENSCNKIKIFCSTRR